jgi:Protein of unknown function (DUF1073)
MVALRSTDKKYKAVVNKAINRITKVAANLMYLSRADLANTLNPPGRNLFADCGYPVGEPTLFDYQEMYERFGPSNRVVSVYPAESWASYPEVYEREDQRVTAFERWWKQFVFEHSPWHYLERADEQSGIGRYGLLLIGLNDGLDLSEPVFGFDGNGNKTRDYGKFPLKVTYLRPFPEYLCTMRLTENDPWSPRFGLPRLYAVRLSDPTNEPLIGATIEQLVDRVVHWTRIIHLVDNRTNSDVFGTPRQRPVLNHLLDLRKILGASAEGYWKSGFPGISFETFPELSATAELDKKSMKEEIDAYANGTNRFLRLVGMTAKPLPPNIQDPKSFIQSQLEMICLTWGIPVPVFMGMQQGHLAGTSNTADWNKKIGKRRNSYLCDKVIKPFIVRLQMLGVAPESDPFEIHWEDINVQSDTDRAKIGLQQSQALLQYVTSGAYVLVPPRKFLTDFLNFSDEEADAIIEEAGGATKIIQFLKQMVAANAGNTPGTSGTNPTSKTGAGGQRNSQGKGRKPKRSN